MLLPGVKIPGIGIDLHAQDASPLAGRPPSLESSNDQVYKATHANHPCSIWVRQTTSNYEWLYALFCYLHEEYLTRFHKPHLSYTLLHALLKEPPVHLSDGGLTQFAQAMPAEYKQPDVVKAYRNYYCSKLHFCQWTPPAYKPWWISDHLLQIERIKL